MNISTSVVAPYPGAAKTVAHGNRKMESTAKMT